MDILNIEEKEVGEEIPTEITDCASSLCSLQSMIEQKNENHEGEAAMHQRTLDLRARIAEWLIEKLSTFDDTDTLSLNFTNPNIEQSVSSIRITVFDNQPPTHEIRYR